MSQEQEIIEAFNTLQMRVLLQGEMIAAIATCLDETTRARIAGCFQELSANAMQEHAHHLTPKDDQAMTLGAAAFLEALGFPPSRF